MRPTMLTHRKFLSLAAIIIVLAALPLSALAGYQRINKPNPEGINSRSFWGRCKRGRRCR